MVKEEYVTFIVDETTSPATYVGVSGFQLTVSDEQQKELKKLRLKENELNQMLAKMADESRIFFVGINQGVESLETIVEQIDQDISLCSIVSKDAYDSLETFHSIFQNRKPSDLFLFIGNADNEIIDRFTVGVDRTFEQKEIFSSDMIQYYASQLEADSFYIYLNTKHGLNPALQEKFQAMFADCSNCNLLDDQDYYDFFVNQSDLPILAKKLEEQGEKAFYSIYVDEERAYLNEKYNYFSENKSEGYRLSFKNLLKIVAYYPKITMYYQFSEEISAEKQEEMLQAIQAINPNTTAVVKDALYEKVRQLYIDKFYFSAVRIIPTKKSEMTQYGLYVSDVMPTDKEIVEIEKSLFTTAEVNEIIKRFPFLHLVAVDYQSALSEEKTTWMKEDLKENFDYLTLISQEKFDAEYKRPMGADKPVIYLYPQKEMEVRVQLDYDGELSVTYPNYRNGWNVLAKPDGTLIDLFDRREYSYLFWEGIDNRSYDMHKGFVVRGSDTVHFLQEKLAYLGLTPKEYNEFIVYWYPLMKDNPYNLITFQQESYSDYAKLHITPKPDSMLRVFMVYQPMKAYREVEEQILTPFVREGFSVIEWGGTAIH